jgi:hypothetical protein
MLTDRDMKVESSILILGYWKAALCRCGTSLFLWSFLQLSALAALTPAPPVAAPPGSGQVIFDLHGNYWTLVEDTLHVLPAQNQKQWIPDSLSAVPEGNWKKVETDLYGRLWLSDGSQWQTMNPKEPQKGWKAEKKPTPDTAWEKDWEVVAYMPSGTHDLSGVVMDDTFYMDWAITGDFGYPSTGATHRHLLAFRPESGWSIVGDYGKPRGYCAVGQLDGKIWTVGGFTPNAEGKNQGTDISQIFDPATGKMTRGPSLPLPLARPLAFDAKARLYVMGYPDGKGVPFKCFSIGPGESKWRPEPDGPTGAGSAYGTQLNGKFYAALDHGDLAIYDPAEKQWTTVTPPQKARSPAVGHYRNEIWIMGGRGGEQRTLIFNPESEEWREGPALPRKLAWGCGFTIDGQLYLTGGTAYQGFNNATYRLRNY